MNRFTRWPIVCTVLLVTSPSLFAIDFTAQDVQTASDRHDMRQLMTLATSAEKPIRLEALQSLVQLKDPQAVPFLTQQLDDPDPDIVTEALWGLPTFGANAATSSVTDRVETLGQHTSADVRKVAAVVLTDLKDPDKLEQMRIWLTSNEDDRRKEALDYYVKRGDLSILIVAHAMLQDPDPVQKQTAIILIHGLEDHDSLDQIEKLLQDPAPNVRAMAAMVVGDWKEASALEDLRLSLKDPNPLVRASAVTALANHQDPAVSAALAGLAKDHDPTVCIALANALTKFASPASADGLSTLALDDNLLIRGPAIAGLLTFHNPAITRKMRAYLTDKSSRKRRRAAIAYLSDPSFHRKAADFLPLLHDKDVGVRLEAVQAVLKLPGNETKAQLVYLLEDPDRDVRLTILKRIDILILIPKVNKRVIKNSLTHLQKDPDLDVQKLARKYKVLAS